MFIRSIAIPLRSAIGFGLIGAVVLIIGLFALAQMREMRAASDEVDQNWLPSLTSLGALKSEIMRVRALTMRAILVDGETLTTTLQTLNQSTKDLAGLNAAYAKNVSLAAERAAYEQFLTRQERYFSEQQKVVALVTQGQKGEALKVVNGPMISHADEMTAYLNELQRINNEAANSAAATSKGAYTKAIEGVVVFMLLAALATIILAVVFTRSIVRPLSQAVSVAETVASGDLAHEFTVEGKDEPARLLTALKAMQMSLRTTIQGITHSSSQLASAAEQLNAVTETSTRGLHQQNHEIEQAAAAVNEMTAAVDEVARNAVSTSEASREADDTAQHGRQQVINTVESIGLLADDVTKTASQVELLAGQVQEISKVLDVIRSIAEQTNLLALNAAIEAARAGDAGRGFAVVADEVRALAHRTQQSTQEIEQMIGAVHAGTNQTVHSMQSSNERARSTLAVARSAGDALDAIALSISQISERNLVIASASEEQAQVAREVDRNLVNIRDLSLQTSAGANQTSASSQELASLALNLNGLVARFRV